jgi:DNA-binding XRE family transcriptional regulator
MGRKRLDNPRLAEVFAVIGKNLLRLRGTMPQKKVAAISGVSRSTIESIEKGLGCNLQNLIKLADAFDIKPADLFISDADRKEVSYLHVLLMEKLKESLTIK